MYEAFNREGLEAVLAHAGPEIEIHDPDRSATVYRGRQGARELASEWLESWDDYRIEVDRLVPNGDKVLAELTQSGRGKGSGIEFSEPFCNVLTFDGDKIAKFEIYIDRQDGRRAAGLAE